MRPRVPLRQVAGTIAIRRVASSALAVRCVDSGRQPDVGVRAWILSVAYRRAN